MLIDTWIISAHGCLVTDNTKEEPQPKYIDIPDNCAVIMLCTNEKAKTNKIIDMWNQISQKNVGWNKYIENKLDIDDFIILFFMNLKNYFHASDLYNTFCLFTDKVPLLYIKASKFDAKQMYCGYSRLGPDTKTNKTRNMQNNFHILIINTCASSEMLKDTISFQSIPINSDRAKEEIKNKINNFFVKGGTNRKILRMSHVSSCSLR